ncbi:unnamed protein product, partial [Polarella glacialis]
GCAALPLEVPAEQGSFDVQPMAEEAQHWRPRGSATTSCRRGAPEEMRCWLAATSELHVTARCGSHPLGRIGQQREKGDLQKEKGNKGPVGFSGLGASGDTVTRLALILKTDAQGSIAAVC